MFDLGKCREQLDNCYEQMGEENIKYSPYNIRKRRRFHKEVAPLTLYTYVNVVKNRKDRVHYPNTNVDYVEQWLVDSG